MPKRPKVELPVTARDLGENEIVYDKYGNPTHSRASKAQVMLRTQQVVAWTLDGLTRKEIHERASKAWGITTRPIDEYIAKANAQIEALAGTEIRSATTLSIYRLSELYDAAMEGGDMKTALDVVKTLNRMLGLNAPEKTETRTVENWDSFSIAEQFELIEKKIGERQMN
jgi:hypothetical protein